jgi:MYXO-CTERM domain-containing protein
MNRWLGSAAVGALLFAGASIAPAQGAPLTVDHAAASGVTMRFQRAASSHAQLVGGLLSAPSSAQPAQIAGAYLATRPEILGAVEPASLRRIDVRQLAGTGATVRYAQTFGGVDVLGGDVFVRIDAQGQVRWAKAATRSIPAGFSVTPGFDAAHAAAVVKGVARFHLAASVVEPAHARLMIDASLPGAAPRLVYVVLAPGNPYLMEAWRVVVDAHTGQIVRADNRVMSATTANVFTSNPVKTPTLQQVSFDPFLTAGQSPIGLVGADVKVMDCLDKQLCTDVDLGMGMPLSVHTCTVVPNLTTPAGGNFLSTARPALDTDGEDAFSEVQMFFHVNQIYGFFRGFGFTDLVDKPLVAVTNLRAPIDFNDLLGSAPLALCTGGVPQPTHHLYGFDNAFFTPDAQAISGVAGGGILFGQGTQIDFSYDGDVIYHEFTHAVMGSLTPDFGGPSFDEFGEDPTTGGMNEGTADYFSSAFAGDPDVGEYAGPPLLGNPPGETALRHLTNDKTCPSSLWNEVHQDGEEWGGALWDVRDALPAGERHTYDQAVYNAIATLVPDDDQISTGAAVAAEVNTLLGASARDLAVAKFTARGLDDCDDRVRDFTGAGAKQDVLLVTGSSQIQLHPVPGALQFKLDVPEGTKQIQIHVAQGSGGGVGSEPVLKLIAKPGADAIHWTYATDASNVTTATSDATLSGDVTCANNACSGAIGADFVAGAYVVQVTNDGADATFQNVTFTMSTMELPDAGPVTGMPDAGPVTGTPDASTPVNPDAGGNPDTGDKDGGCGCRVGGDSGRAPLGGLAFAGLAAFLIVVTTRRKRR